MKKRRKEEKREEGEAWRKEKREEKETSRRRSERFGGKAGTGRRLYRCSALPSTLLQASAFTLVREEPLEGFEERYDVMGLPSNWSLAAALRTDCRRAKAKASSNKIKVRQKKTNII